jgi:hypothetical protein
MLASFSDQTLPRGEAGTEITATRAGRKNGVYLRHIIGQFVPNPHIQFCQAGRPFGALSWRHQGNTSPDAIPGPRPACGFATPSLPGGGEGSQFQRYSGDLPAQQYRLYAG